MVQLPAAGRQPLYAGRRIDDVLEAGLAEAGILAANGIDAMMVQNLGDIPVATKSPWFRRPG